MVSWHILTGEYPPQPGGVSDYTRLVAQGLARAGDRVQVWSPPCAAAAPVDAGVEVHRLPDHFGPRSLSCLNDALRHNAPSQRILVQYVPQAFGWKALNLPFCLWLWARRREPLWVMFHEVYFPLSRRQPLAHNMLGVGTRLMAALVARAAQHIFVSTTGWCELLKPLVSQDRSITWLPVPSSIQKLATGEAIAATRAKYLPHGGRHIIGHFGSFGSNLAALLIAALPALLAARADRVLLLLGRGGERVRDELVRKYPNLTGRVHATGALPASDISRHLSASDLLIQPFVDGVSTRRTSVMAGLLHGVPIVTTTGPATESLWAASGAVALVPVGEIPALVEAVERLLADAAERQRLRTAGQTLYQDRFELSHTIAALRKLSC